MTNPKSKSWFDAVDEAKAKARARGEMFADVPTGDGDTVRIAIDPESQAEREERAMQIIEAGYQGPPPALLAALRPKPEAVPNQAEPSGSRPN